MARLLRATADRLSPSPAPRRVLVTGGTRSGKSAYAESLLADAEDVTYVATSFPRPGDDAWSERVALHVARRPTSWRTLETLDVAGLFADPGATVLVDCVSLWLAARLDSDSLAADCDELVDAWSRARARVVLVTAEVGSGVHAETAMGREYADQLGRLNARLATEADAAWLVVAGQPLRLR